MFNNLLFHINEIIDDFILLFQKEWLIWGSLIIVLFPIILITINEVVRRLSTEHDKIKQLILTFRNIILPLIVLYILMIKISILSSDDFYLKVITTILWLLILNFSLKFFNAILLSESFKFEEKVPKLLIDIARIFLILLGSTFIISFIWNVDLTKLLTALGMGSLVLGLALKDILSSLFSGVALISSKPFKVGDWIRVGDSEGQVVNINWRSVSIRNKGNFIIIIPNSVIVKKELSNFSQPDDKVRMKIGIDFSVETSPNKLIKLLIETAKKVPNVLENPAPNAFLDQYSEGIERSAHYKVTFFIPHYKNKTAVKKVFMSHVWYMCQRENIPFSKEYAPEDWEYSYLDSQSISKKIRELHILDIHDEDFTLISENSRILQFGESEVILDPQKTSDNFYIVLSGKLRQCFYDSTSSKNFDNSEFYNLSKGDFFGFSGIIIQKSEDEFVQAVVDSTVISINMATLLEVLHKHPQVSDCLEGILSSKKNLIN